MPLYNVEHSFPLKQEQKQDLAERITHIHSRAFTTPSIYVQVKFHQQDASASCHFAGGRVLEQASNRIMGYVRASPKRTHDDFQKVCESVENAWLTVVGLRAEDDDSDAKKKAVSEETGARRAAKELLTVTLIPGLVGREKGYPVAEAGGEEAWFKKYRKEFEQKAELGDEDFKSMLEEVDNRDDLKAWRGS